MTARDCFFDSVCNVEKATGDKTMSYTDNSPHRRPRVLFFAPFPPPIGGATVSSELLLSRLKQRDNLTVTIVNMSRKSIGTISNLKMLVYVFWQLLRVGSQHDLITFHANSRARMLAGPWLYLCARLLGKPIIMRAFGGSFDEQYQRLPRFYQLWMRRTYLQADVCLLESHKMVDYFSSVGARRAEWFSNFTRDAGLIQSTPYKTHCNRFVFLGRVIREKGIDTILQAIPLLDPMVQIDIYGPLDDSFTAQSIDALGAGKVVHRGILHPEQIVEKLWDYDALVLPTYWPGEGYPAVVLEAYAHGIPVIVTKWLVLEEIVDQSSGILIDLKSPDQLATAINHLHRDKELYESLQKGARCKASRFSAEKWAERFEQLCYDLVEQSRNE